MRAIVRIDVSDAAGLGESLGVAATIVAPEDGSDNAVVFFGFPGGGYNRRYYDLQLPGHAAYSQAEFHAQRGQVFVALDHLGTGESDVPRRALTFEDVARVNQLAAAEVVRRLEAGEAAPGLPPLTVDTAVAMGQSYGAFLLIIGQAHHPVFDGIAILGYSAVRAGTPWSPSLTIEDLLSLRAGNGLDHPMTPYFHRTDVPQDIVVADMTKLEGTAGSAAPWSTAHFPGGPALVHDRNPRDPGVIAAEATAVRCPVLIGCGEVDVVADPQNEPSAYRRSGHVTVTVVEGMAHMHNFAGTRERLWRSIEGWVASWNC